MDLDQIEDVPENSRTELEESAQVSIPIKIKTEPIYEGYEENEEDAFEVVGTFEDDVSSGTDDGSGKFMVFVSNTPCSSIRQSIYFILTNVYFLV